MDWLLRRLLALWVRFKVRPEETVAHLRERDNPVCYVLERRSATDFAVLQTACVRLKLVRPRKKLAPQLKELSSVLFLSRPRGFWGQRLDRRPPAQLQEIIATVAADPRLDIELIPVAVYWGRAPQKEASWFRLLLVEDWAFTTRARKFMQVLFNGRNTLIEFDEPVSLRGLLGPEAGAAVRGRRVARALRILYAKQRAARIGPDLSHRRIIVNRVLRTRAVRAALAQEIREKNLTKREASLKARQYAEEIAANYSHAFVRFLEAALSRLWNRLYDGVVFGHVETLERTAEGNEVIYVPCHRSHMDYLLLSYAIFVHGYAIPHIAAGINLNLPIVGRLLRKGGAFFIRRSFRGNALYTGVFMKYLAAIMARGHSIEYFIEGGRSRTGRLLQPKTGMLSMTVLSFLRDPVRPIVFIPVYFGYERIVEGSTYIGELSGKPKEKESVLGLLRTLRRLRERFGQVHVNLGEPIELGSLLDRHDPQWRERGLDDDERVPWIGAAVDELASRIMRNINSAAVVTPINLLAITLLATPRLALPRSDLLRQMDLYRDLLQSYAYSDRVSVTSLPSAEILSYGESMKVISREQHALGDIIRMSDEAAVLATYFRNNILHLFAMPSLVACAFLSNSSVRTEDIQRLTWRIYPYIAAELFLRWSEQELPGVVTEVLVCLEKHGLIEGHAARSEWRRPPPASIQAEFFDRTMFENFLDLLRGRGVIRLSEGGKLEFDEVLMRVAADAQFVLSEQIRHSILQVTHG
jgi:glycerol-3-phosphate O-acyltransferase